MPTSWSPHRRADRAVQVEHREPVGRARAAEGEPAPIGEADRRSISVETGHTLQKHVTVSARASMLRVVTSVDSSRASANARRPLHHRDVPGAGDRSQRRLGTKRATVCAPPGGMIRSRSPQIAPTGSGRLASSGRRSAAGDAGERLARSASRRARRRASRAPPPAGSTTAPRSRASSAASVPTTGRRGRRRARRSASPRRANAPTARAAIGDIGRSPAGATSTSRRTRSGRPRRERHRDRAAHRMADEVVRLDPARASAVVDRARRPR